MRVDALLLRVPGGHDPEIHRDVQLAARSMGIVCRRAPAGAFADVGALAVVWGADDEGGRHGPGDPAEDMHFDDTVRAFHRAGRPILAPCMALASALAALTMARRDAACLHMSGDEHGVIVFPALRLVSTSRPLLGLGRERQPILECCWRAVIALDHVTS